MKVTIREILASVNDEGLDFRLVAGTSGLDNELTLQEINRPGLALTGFFEHFGSDRLQIFGKGECAYINQLSPDELNAVLDQLFGYKFVGMIFTWDYSPPQQLCRLADKNNVPIFITSEPTSQFIRVIANILEDKFAPMTSMHGVLIEVFGVGVLLLGRSGVGKSETALELIERGHRLVADDLIFIKVFQNHNLIGAGSALIKYHMEIRGLGIINVKDIFGAGAVRKSKSIDLIVTIEEWDKNKEYERLGEIDNYMEILGMSVTHLVIPLRPGRNLPIIVETAAMNHRLKRMGYNPAKELNEKIQEHLKLEETEYMSPRTLSNF